MAISASVVIDYAAYDVTAVDGNAFYGAKKLKTVQYKGTIRVIERLPFK